MKIHKAGEILKHIKDKAKCIFYDVGYFTSDIFPKAFFLMAFSKKKHFPYGDFPSDNFLSGNFANLKFPERQLSKGLVRPSKTRGPTAAARTNLGSYRLGK